MAGSDLDTELRRRAEGNVEAVLGAARADAERIASEANRLIEERRRESTKERNAEYGSEARVAIAAERHAAKRTVLLARTRLVDQVLERARALLPEAAETDIYRSEISGELGEALDFVDGDGDVVRCSKRLAAVVRASLRDRPKVKGEPEADIGTGFIVVGGAGSVVVDGRLETRMERLASSLAIEIFARMQEL